MPASTDDFPLRPLEAGPASVLYEIFEGLYPGDYFADTLELAASEHRALRLILLRCWLEGGVIADSHALASAARLAFDAWQEMAANVTPLVHAAAPRIADKMRELRLYDGQRLPAADWRVVRAVIFERDGHRCTYCGVDDCALEGDHIVPLSRGGSNLFENVTTACRRCNLRKGAKTPEEWRA